MTAMKKEITPADILPYETYAKERKERRARNEALFELVGEVAAGLGEPWVAANRMKDEDMDANYPTFEILQGLGAVNAPRIRVYLSRDGRLVFSGMAPDRSHNVVSTTRRTP